jgi:hypothetical protein
VSTLTEIIGTSVNDDSSTNDRLGAEERNVLVCLSADDPAKRRLVSLPEIWTEAFPDPSVLTFPGYQL